MLTGGWDVAPLYYLYAVLAFAEVAILFVSAISLFVFLVSEIVRTVDRLLDAAISGRWLAIGRPSPARDHRLRKVLGGHNERF
jgi:hypothetical protein